MFWHFSPLLADQVETEITQRDQFNNDDVDISETIIREAIQNSLDAAAGVLASGVMTPVDVLKTRLATGTCPVDVRSCFLWVIKEEGIAGLYSGAGSRMIFSGAFSAIGFGTFEWAKGVLGVSTTKPSAKPIASSSAKKKKKSVTSAKKKEYTKSDVSAKGLIATKQ